MNAYNITCESLPDYRSRQEEIELLTGLYQEVGLHIEAAEQAAHADLAALYGCCWSSE